MKKTFIMAVMAATLLMSAVVFAEKNADQPTPGDSQKIQGPGPRGGGPGQGPGMRQTPGQPQGGMMGEEGMVMRELKGLVEDSKTVEELKLTADQQGKIKALTVDFEKFTIKQNADRALLMIDLKTEMDKDQIDMVKIQDLADKISKNRAEMTKQLIMVRAQAIGLLTKEQRVKAKDLRQERREMMMKKFKEGKK